MEGHREDLYLAGISVARGPKSLGRGGTDL